MGNFWSNRDTLMHTYTYLFPSVFPSACLPVRLSQLAFCKDDINSHPLRPMSYWFCYGCIYFGDALNLFWCIGFGALILVHSPWCFYSGTFTLVHLVWCIPFGVFSVVHSLCCIHFSTFTWAHSFERILLGA